MPLLRAEPNLFPQCLFEAPACDRGEGCAWRVAHTRPRQEKALARELHRAGVSFYLPLVTCRSLIRGRPVKSHLPLFPGYLFLLGGREKCFQASKATRLVRLLEVKDQEGLESELRQVHRLLASGAPVTPEARLAEGATVEIRQGVLAGLRGKIVRAASGNRFVVQVNFLQQGASVLLDDFYLAAVVETGAGLGDNTG